MLAAPLLAAPPCAPPLLHLCSTPTLPIQLHRLPEPAIPSHGCDEAVICLSAALVRLQRSSQGERPPLQVQRSDDEVLKSPPCAPRPKKQLRHSQSAMLQQPLALATEQTGVPGISSGQASASQVTASLASPVATLPVGCLTEACLSKGLRRRWMQECAPCLARE
ncbi:hypothetical protein AOQ84DRAFT_123673 [Glonium stellatum]|uniref:Uncharacterized protein n=1 Tax=Glonium stellatum TaxID=574774 RepID=A0A8E2ETC0_9PEZI|nr:hypothetical protein AOQ84DRAFT_123673 [Glonium stellatum]